VLIDPAKFFREEQHFLRGVGGDQEYRYESPSSVASAGRALAASASGETQARMRASRQRIHPRSAGNSNIVEAARPFATPELLSKVVFERGSKKAGD
jgi:hypothetical protein